MSSTRTAFELYPALVARNALISCAAVSHGADRLYLGLQDGQLEEHRIGTAPGGSVQVALGARKHVSRKAIQAVHQLEACRRLAVQVDGVVQLLDQETLEGQSLPGVKGVTAMAADTSAARAPRLALALRISRKAVRLMVFEVLPGAEQAGSAALSTLCMAQKEVAELLSIKALAWLAGKLVLCTSLRYVLLSLKDGSAEELLAVSRDAPPPTFVLAIPAAEQALLLLDDVGILINSAGRPLHSAVTFPSPPLALAVAGLYILAACSDGVHVLDRSTGAWAQTLTYPDGAVPAPGQPVLMSCNADGSCVVLAGLRKVWLLKPIALESQAREMLREGAFEQALSLAETCAKDGAPWTETAFAEAAFLLMQDLRFLDAMEVFRRCSPAVFQPVELAPLFPDATARWRHLLPVKPYWGLHAPLRELHALVRSVLQHRHRTADGISSGSSDAASSGRGSSGHGSAHPSSTGLQQQVDNIAADARQSIAAYVLQVRTQPGITAPDVVDTMLAHLLAMQDGLQLVAFAAQPNAAVVTPALGQLLQQKHMWQAHALFQANSGEQGLALQLWQDLAQGKLQDALANDQTSQAAVAQSAAEHAAAALGDEAAVTDALALQHLTWLVAAAPAQALTVLEARSMDPGDVMPILRTGAPADLICSYLHHVVVQRGSQQAALHTELATTLVAVCAGRQHRPEHQQLLLDACSGADAKSDAARDPRRQLQQLLQESDLYDAASLLQQLQQARLMPEQVILHQKAGQHMAALRLLAHDMEDIVAAEAYCARHMGPEGYAGLLDLLLQPGDGRTPMFAQACHLLAAKGAHLDPTRVMDALADNTPLHLAVGTLAHMIRERTHRRRQGQIVRNLQRSCHMNAAADRAELLGRAVPANEERACRLCHTRIGNKMFAVYPSGTLVCFKCYSRSSPTVCPVTGLDFRTQSASGLHVWPD